MVAHISLASRKSEVVRSASDFMKIVSRQTQNRPALLVDVVYKLGRKEDWLNPEFRNQPAITAAESHHLHSTIAMVHFQETERMTSLSPGL